MKKLIIVLLLLVVGVVGATVVAAYVADPEFYVEREVVISGQPDAVYEYLDTLPKWPEWTVWTKEKYPNMEVTYTGPERGVGAESSWTDPDNGNGRMVITKSNPVDGIEYEMFFEGFPKSECALKMAKVPEGIKVTMSMKGSMGSNPMFRIVGLFVDMDEAIGSEFDAGLGNLKKVIEDKS